MVKFLNVTGIKKKFTALYHPSGNGVVERINRVIKGIIQLTNKGNKNCNVELRNMLWAFRTTPH